MPTTARPDIRHAKAWLQDARVQLHDLAREHNDSRLADLAATIEDVANRAPLPVEKGAVVVMTESAIDAYHEALGLIMRAQAWAENMDGYDLRRVYDEANGHVEAQEELHRRRESVAKMELSLYRGLSHLATVAQDHDGPCTVTRDSPGSFFWIHAQSGYHGGLIFQANYAAKGTERLPVGTWSIHT